RAPRSTARSVRCRRCEMTAQWLPARPLRWIEVASLLREEQPGTTVRLAAAHVEHPHDAGMLPSLAVPIGQRVEYRLHLGEGHDLVVADFVSSFKARLESRATFADFERALREVPGTSVAGLI